MIRAIDAEKALEALVEIWASQNNQKVTRRGSNEKNNINDAVISNSI